MSTNLIDGLSINHSNGHFSEPVANRNTCSSDMFPLIPPEKNLMNIQTMIASTGKI